MLDDVFIYENFFEREFINNVFVELQAAKPDAVDFIDNAGMFKGQLISKQKHIKDHNLPNLSILLKKVESIFDCPVVFRIVNFQTLYLPWDIHSDWSASDNSESYYNLLIPLADVDSRTIMFNQKTDAGSKHFYIYKQKNQKVTDPVPLEIWNQYLDFCWPEDREYLSLKKILPPQRAGQLIGFLRNIIHSSDNFHIRGQSPKYFLQIYVDKKI